MEIRSGCASSCRANEAPAPAPRTPLGRLATSALVPLTWRNCRRFIAIDEVRDPRRGVRTARQRSEPSQKWQGNIRLPRGCARRTRYAALWRTLASDVTLRPRAGRGHGAEAVAAGQP